MHNRTPDRNLWLVSFALLLVGGASNQAAGPRTAEVEFFEKRIRPVLVEHCYACHSANGKTARGGLRLDSRDALRKGGNSGPAIVPGKPAESLLLKAVRHASADLEMPPKRKLPASIITDLEKWIGMGAPDPRDQLPQRVPVSRHWSFQPVRSAAPPVVRDVSWTRTPVDRFIRARLETLGLSPAPEADRRTLIRRVTFDLTGLPPTPEEVSAFVGDTRPDAYERVVDRLLVSVAHGERWGRHWLDVVRYADTAGETADFPAPHAWRYRNYVVGAFARDMPYDQFLREQLAGDILAGTMSARRPEMIVATGYLAISRRFGFDIEADQYLTIEDTIDTLGKSILGLTIGCARCHDHKYDPVSAKDYYALYGIFSSTRYAYPGCEKVKRSRDLVPLAPKPSSEVAYAVSEGKPHDARLHRRGDPAQLGEAVPRRFLERFGGQAVPTSGGSGRLALAGWLTDPGNPLVARVMVNRIWQHHIGAGLVTTPNDFGTRGNLPSHPELLDHLAHRFVTDGWSIKSLHRLIVLSATYRQSSEANPEARRIDPDNVWLSRFSRRRLSAEEIRDAILTVSGDLDRTPGGPHPFPAEQTWNFTQHAPFTAVYEHDRRSVYLMTQRIVRHPFLGLFDGADPNSSTGQRDTTTVPTQALFFLNDPFVHAKAARLAERLLALPDDVARIDRLCQVCFSRPATNREKEIATRFLSAGTNRQQRWAGWVRVQMASNEFIHLD